MLRRNIIYGFIGQTGLLFLSLISTRLIFKQLGADVLGIINFAVVGTFFLISLADMGITPTITREVAAHKNNDSEYVNNLISTMSLFCCLTFVACSLIAGFLSPVAVKSWLKIETINQSSAILALQIISVSLLLAIPRSIYGAFINGFQRLDFWNVSNLIYFGLQQLGMIIVLNFGGELLKVAVWYLISAFIGLIPYIIFLGRLIGWKMMVPRYCSGIFSRNLKFGSVIFANSILGYFLTQMDRWTISKFLPVSQLGYYGFAQGLVSKGAMKAGVKRFVGIGTCFEYDLTKGILSIETPLRPLTPYAGTKAATFVALSQLLPSQGVEFIWCRFFYLYGEGEDIRRLVPYLHTKLSVGEPAELTSGNQIRDFLEVSEAGKMIAEVSLGAAQGAVNICSGIPVTVRQLAEKIADKYGRRDLLKFGACLDNFVDPACVVGVK